MVSEYIKGWIVGSLSTLAGALIGTMGAMLMNPEKNYIPETAEVRAGYVVPNKLEIKVEDLDRNGEKETVMVYDGKQYLLRLDDKGRPVVQAYVVKSAQVIPAQIVPTTQPEYSK